MKTRYIRINAKLIRSYKPCLEGLANFTEHYTDISIKELINSEKISYYNKGWLLKRIVPSELLVLWAIDSAFAAYKNFDNNSNYYSPYHYANAAECAAAYAANAAANAASRAPYSAATAAVDAAGAAANAANLANAADAADAQNERLQALLYFIEGE